MSKPNDRQLNSDDRKLKAIKDYNITLTLMQTLHVKAYSLLDTAGMSETKEKTNVETR